MSNSILDRTLNVKKRIEQACDRSGRSADEITLVAVSKTKPNKDILKLAETGQIHFGENRAKELEDKMEQIANPELQWHFIGTLQTNKIKYMAHRVDWIESVHKKKALKEIEKRAGYENRVINALVQVNISREDQKSGCDPNQLPAILEYGQDLKHVRVCGLMGMATFADDPETVRPEFKKLKELFDTHTPYNGGSVQLKHLSMGMTNDFEIAIEEGATMIRIGSAIFGERNY